MITVKSTRLLDVHFNSNEDAVLFKDPETTDGPEFKIPRDVWNDMGAPYQITVTIEPGDRLNVSEGP